MKISAFFSNLIKFLSVFCVLLQATFALSSSVEETIIENIKKNLPDFDVESVEEHGESGLYLVKLLNGPSLHAMPNGKYFVVGDLYRLDADGLVNETEIAKLAQIESLPKDEMVIFPATGEEKGHVSVFTDITCGYCRMLHGEIEELNNLGITVRYLAYPRAGLNSEPYQQMVSIWCSDDPQGWMTKAKQGQKVPTNSCTNPVASQFQLGQSIGVRGTPTLVLGTGKLIPGYLPAAELAKALDL